MKHIFTFFLACLFAFSANAQNCTSLFSYHTNNETVDFNNRSTVSNAHYWWNFGDGTSSHFKNPSHTFPDNGTFLVTLFIKDTISNCSNYSERWITVTKFSEEDCFPQINDSFFSENGTDYIKLIDSSTNCEAYNRNYDVGPAMNFVSINSINLSGGGWKSARFISRVKYFTSSYEIKRAAYKTSPYNYTGSKNYTDCSANFEFSVIAEDATGQRILFEAMNKNAVHYEWEVSGFGNPIISNDNAISIDYLNLGNDLKIIGLKTIGASGCKDTFYQEILIRPTQTNPVGINPTKTQSANVEIFPNPFAQQATFKFPNPDKLNYSLVVTNTLGQVVNTINDVRKGEIMINRDGLSTGVYFYQLACDGQYVATGKFMVVD